MRTQPDKLNKLDPGSTHGHVLAGMKTSCLHFSAFALLAAGLALLAGCAQMPSRGSSHAQAAQPLARMDLPTNSPDGEASALVIAAEFALQNDDGAKAARDYAAAARISSDPAVAKRALQLALATGDAASAAALVQRWRALGADPRGLAAAQARIAMLGGNRAEAERQFGILLSAGGIGDWKTFAASLLVARDTALAGRILEDIATPTRLPNDEATWVTLSQLAEHLGQHAFARKLADAAVTRFSGADSIRWAAGLKLGAGDRTGAQALYATGVAAHSRNVDLRLGYAELLGSEHKYAQALKVLQRGQQTGATWSAQVAYAARARDDAALRRIYSQMQHAPEAQRIGSAFLLGQLAELLKHDQQALQWYGKVDPDGPHGFEAQVRSAALLDKAGKSVQAHALAVQLQQEYSDDPDSLRTAYELDAQLYAQHAEHAKAIAAYDRGLAALPGDPVLTYDRGVEEANAGDTDAALKDFREVLAKNPDNVDAMNALGFTLADAGRDLPEATKLLRKALAAKPDAAAILDSWGWLQYRLGDLDQARTYLLRAWSGQQDPDVGVHLGEVLWKLGQQQHAREVFAKVRKLDPDNSSLRRVERKLHP